MTIYIGVDVSKKKLDIFIKNGNKFLSIENSVEAINNFIKTLNYKDDILVGL